MSLFTCSHCSNSFSTLSVFKNFLFSRPALSKKVKCAQCECVLQPEKESPMGQNKIFSASLFIEILWYLLFLAGGFLVWKVLLFFNFSIGWVFIYIAAVIIGFGYQVLEGRSYDILKKQ